MGLSPWLRPSVVGAVNADGTVGNPVVVVVVSVHQAMVCVDVVVELPEHPARVVLGGIQRIDAGLRIVVALILERAEEPQLVAARTARPPARTRR